MRKICTGLLSALLVAGLGACSAQQVSDAASSARAASASATSAASAAQSAASAAASQASAAAAAASSAAAQASSAGSAASAAASSAAAGLSKANPNTASQAEIQQALESAGVENAGTWAAVIKQHAPYTAENLIPTLRQALADQQISAEQFARLLSALDVR